MVNLREEKRLQLRTEIFNAVKNLYLEGYTWIEILKKMDYKSPRSLAVIAKNFTKEERKMHNIAMFTRRLNKLKSGENVV